MFILKITFNLIFLCIKIPRHRTILYLSINRVCKFLVQHRIGLGRVRLMLIFSLRVRLDFNCSGSRSVSGWDFGSCGSCASCPDISKMILNIFFREQLCEYYNIYVFICQHKDKMYVRDIMLNCFSVFVLNYGLFFSFQRSGLSASGSV